MIEIWHMITYEVLAIVHRANLIGVDLSGNNLTGAHMAGADLTDANLSILAWRLWRS